MRRPGIHVTEQDLIEQLRVLGYKITDTDAVSLVKALRSKQLVHRSILQAPTAGQASKMRGQKTADKEVMRLYGLLVTSTQVGSLRLRAIRPGQTGWTDVVALVEAAKTFTRAFDIEPADDGVLRYFELARQHLGDRFSLRAAAACYEQVSVTFQAQLEILLDPNAQETERLFQRYVTLARIGAKAATALREHKTFISFVRATAQAVELTVPVDRWVSVQFEELAWTSRNPSPSQLYGPDALARWLKVSSNKGTSTVASGPKTDKRLQYEELLKKRTG